ncbi:hypothetical protein [Pseudonocardia humida]|uniref:Uncharacterized protein n=1 Tax=Pseudonocardia humida TaxID=2800819 RepID=A0ABT0ZTP5_9PSEU|nr:hypothetical protein [Pseudonocardia humida]MCO1654101.1 hypothetical protein [Pseudonocardia humida]
MTEVSDVWPEPVEGAPLTARAAAELALAAAVREVSDFARSMVPTGSVRDRYDGLLIADARQLTALAGRALAAAVVVERTDGTPWPAVAQATGEDPRAVRARWEPAVERWETAAEQAAIPVAADDADDPPVATEAVIAELDAWVVRHREPHDPATGEHPVSAALGRMDPLHELLHLAAVRRRLAALHDGTSPPEQLLPLVQREADVQEHLAATADAADRQDHERAAARARTMAAHLRARTDGEDLPAG